MLSAMCTLPEMAQSGKVALSLLKAQTTRAPILSIGVSDAGVSEINFVRETGRKVIATTIDMGGLDFSQKLARQVGAHKNLVFRLSDIRFGLPDFESQRFGFIYARQSLHYLDRDELSRVLPELKRVLIGGGMLYVVVKSREDVWANHPSARYDAKTGMTTWRYPRNGNSGRIATRHYFTPQSLSRYAERAGFVVEAIRAHKEVLYWDYCRMKKDTHAACLLIMCCIK